MNETLNFTSGVINNSNVANIIIQPYNGDTIINSNLIVHGWIFSWTNSLICLLVAILGIFLLCMFNHLHEQHENGKGRE